MEKTANLGRLRIMLVEDNAHMVLIVKAILRGMGVKEIIEARDISDAWTRLLADPVDMVIMDRVLHSGDGLDLVRDIRQSADSPNPYMPVIMLSAHAERKRVEEARDAGVTEFCRKPIAARDLFVKIAAAIDQPRSFVRTEGYFGPDRRRHRREAYEGPERRDLDG